MTKDILFNNSNTLYDLRLQVEFNELSEPPKSLTYNAESEPSVLIHPQLNSLVEPVPFPPARGPGDSYEPPPFLPPTELDPPVLPSPPKIQVFDVQLFETFTKQNPGVKFVHVQWIDYMATVRARIVPMKEFGRLVRSGERIGISQGNTGTLQNDFITPIVNPVGQIYVEPDLRSLRLAHKKHTTPSATVLSFLRDESGLPIRECPRANLEALVSDLQFNHGISLLCGFEIEVTFLTRDTSNKDQPYSPLTRNHAWGTLTPEQWTKLPILIEMATALEDIGIDVQQFHAESGPGQFEFILEPQTPLKAIDSLIQARQVIAQIAALYSLRATLHPQPFPGSGTAAHAHISLTPPKDDIQFFVGGVLRHLPAICAFTMPEASSYSRVIDDHWTGGTWVAWGTQNRETPLRRVKNGRWEVRCLDGFANMYFALSAIIAAGLLGLKGQATEFPQKDVPYNPSVLREEQRRLYGIERKMPASVGEALEALKEDAELKEILAEGLVHDFVVMKECELKMLGEMDDAERRMWLIERY